MFQATNGYYYMGGDDQCARYSVSSDDNSVIICYTKDDEYTGERYPLTDAQINFELQKRQRDQAALNGLIQQMNNYNQSLERNRMRTVNCYRTPLGITCNEY